MIVASLLERTVSALEARIDKLVDHNQNWHQGNQELEQRHQKLEQQAQEQASEIECLKGLRNQKGASKAVKAPTKIGEWFPRKSLVPNWEVSCDRPPYLDGIYVRPDITVKIERLF